MDPVVDLMTGCFVGREPCFFRPNRLVLFCCCFFEGWQNIGKIMFWGYPILQNMGFLSPSKQHTTPFFFLGWYLSFYVQFLFYKQAWPVHVHAHAYTHTTLLVIFFLRVVSQLLCTILVLQTGMPSSLLLLLYPMPGKTFSLISYTWLLTNLNVLKGHNWQCLEVTPGSALKGFGGTFGIEPR